MKIKRYSMGGLHYTADLPSSNNPQSASANTQSAKKEDNTIQKEIINIIKEHGVTNDVNYFTNAVSQMLSSTASMDPFSNSTDYTMAQLLRIQNLANRVKRSSKLYDNAVNRIDAENSDADVAITSTGSLYVQHEGKLKTISASEYSKNPDEYTPVTTGDLIKVREYDPNLVFNTSILTDLSGQVGMKTIIDYLRTTITAYGKIEKTSNNSHYSTKQLNDIDKGLVQMFGNNPVFKNTIKTTVSDQAYTASASEEERSHQINAAANYLWSTLNGDMQNVLRANAALRSRIDKNSSPVDIILQAINAHTDHKIATDIDSDFQKELSNSGAGNGSSTKTVEKTREEMMLAGDVVIDQLVPIRSNESKAGLTIQAQSMGRPVDRQGDFIGMSTMTELLNRDQFTHSIDVNSISMGDQILSETDLGRVVYDGTSQISRAVLPYDIGYYNTTGQYKVDFAIIDAFEQFVKWMQKENPQTQNAVIAKLQEMGLAGKISYNHNTNQWEPSNTHLFFMVNGYASDSYVNGIKDNKWTETLNESGISKSNGDLLTDRYFNIVQYGTDKPNKKSVKIDDASRSMWLRDWRHIRKSLIFMPVLDPGIATLTTNNQLMPQSKYFNIGQQRIANQNQIKTNF